MKIQVISVLLLLSAEHIFGLDFYQKHVVTKWDRDCDEKMKAINKGLIKCKYKNTFIVDLNNLLGDICKGQQDQVHVTSKQRFDTYDCVQDSDDFLPEDPVEKKDCTYREGKKKSIKIDVVCGRYDKPVHYGKPDGRITHGKKKK
uniref:Ribonuclease A-domain domain-containing protein n=1 Tax=Oryzias latipes TaxID=8090 RepID=A0A3P9HUS2_ORYLA